MADLANYVKFLRGTPGAYEALATKDSNTLYFIVAADQKVGKLYLGDILVAGNVTDDGSSVLDTLGELTDVKLEGAEVKDLLGFNGEYWVPMTIAEALGDSNLIADTQIFEIEVAAGADHSAAIATIVGEKPLKNGDIAIVKELINGNKRQYTSYVYDDTWKAMDGNYNAENVFFDEDITITTNVGNIEVENGNGSIPAAGKNLKQVFEAMYTKEDEELTIDTPSVSFSLSNSGAATGEVGSPITLPTATLTISDTGSYEYGSKDSEGNNYSKDDGTGIVFTNLRAAFGGTASDAETGAYEEKKDVSLTSGSVAYTAKNTQVTEPLFLDSAKSYTFSYSATYSNDENPRKPVTNLGNFIGSDGKATPEYEDGTKAIAGTTLTGSSTWKATGYRKWFWGYKLVDEALADPTTITSAQVRSLQKNGTSAPSSYTVPANTKQVYFVFPAGKKSTLSIANKSALGAPVACEKKASFVQVADYRGTTKNEAGEDVVNNPVAYDLWFVNLDSSFSGSAELTLTWA